MPSDTDHEDSGYASDKSEMDEPEHADAPEEVEGVCATLGVVGEPRKSTGEFCGRRREVETYQVRIFVTAFRSELNRCML